MSSPSGILLVGGTGFIGRALAASFAAEGWEVHVLSRKPALDLPAGVQAHVGDQGDKALLNPLLARCAHVIHLASATTPGDTVWSPSAEAEASLIPALRFLDCFQGYPESRVIFVSTGGTLYGNAEGANETTLPVPGSYHGAGKVALEAFFSVLGQRRPGGLTILRPSNVYGPGQACGNPADSTFYRLNINTLSASWVCARLIIGYFNCCCLSLGYKFSAILV